MFLKARGIAIPCLIHPDRPAILEASHRAMVNHEIFFFSDERSLSRFHKDLLRYCGVLTDPVSRVRFKPSAKSLRWEYRERPYYFASDSTLSVFQAIPDSFACRMGM